MENINKILYMGIGVIFMFSAIFTFFQREDESKKLYQKYNEDKYEYHKWVDVSSKTEDTSYMNTKEVKKIIYGYLTQNKTTKKEVVLNGEKVGLESINKVVENNAEYNDYNLEYDEKNNILIIDGKRRE